LPKPRKVDQALRELHKRDKRFEFYMGKGSHRIIWHPDIQGQARSISIPYHKGRDILPCYLKDIIKRFELPSDFFG
jgi:predicted RNA binding protein YcfA (HicA-like mRNA interferase family)